MYNITHNFKPRSVVATPKKLPELDELYVFKTHFKTDLKQKQQPEYQYMSHGVLVKAPEGEIYTYMETFEIDGVSIGISLVTKESRKSYIAKFFKQAIKDIRNNKADEAKKCRQSPSKIGLSYFA